MIWGYLQIACDVLGEMILRSKCEQLQQQNYWWMLCDDYEVLRVVHYGEYHLRAKSANFHGKEDFKISHMDTEGGVVHHMFTCRQIFGLDPRTRTGYCPRSKTLTPPSPPTKYSNSFSSILCWISWTVSVA